MGLAGLGCLSCLANHPYFQALSSQFPLASSPSSPWEQCCHVLRLVMAERGRERESWSGCENRSCHVLLPASAAPESAQGLMKLWTDLSPCVEASQLSAGCAALSYTAWKGQATEASGGSVTRGRGEDTQGSGNRYWPLLSLS